MAEYTRRQFTRWNDLGVSEEYRTYGLNSATLAYVDHYNGAQSAAYVFDPYTGRSRKYSIRSKDRIMAIVERHLDCLGYKKCVEFRTLTGEVITD